MYQLIAIAILLWTFLFGCASKNHDTFRNIDVSRYLCDSNYALKTISKDFQNTENNINISKKEREAHIRRLKVLKGLTYFDCGNFELAEDNFVSALLMYSNFDNIDFVDVDLAYISSTLHSIIIRDGYSRLDQGYVDAAHKSWSRLFSNLETKYKTYKGKKISASEYDLIESAKEKEPFASVVMSSICSNNYMSEHFESIQPGICSSSKAVKSMYCRHINK